MKKMFHAAFAAALMLAATAIHAETWSYAFVGHDAHGSQISASGFIEANGDGDSFGLVTAMTGTYETKHGHTVTDHDITFVPPSSTGISASGTWQYDDLFAGNLTPAIDHAGLLFTIGGTEYNLYTEGSQYVLGMGNNLNSYTLTNVKFIDDSVACDPPPVSTVPEPSGLLLGGLGALPLLFRRRKLSA